MGLASEQWKMALRIVNFFTKVVIQSIVSYIRESSFVYLYVLGHSSQASISTCRLPVP